MKRGSTGARNAGLEPYSEFYTSQIARELKLTHVDYGLRKHGERVCSVCDAFTSESIGYLPFAAVSALRSLLISVIKLFEQYGFRKEAVDMFIFDAVIFNEDRYLEQKGPRIGENFVETARALIYPEMRRKLQNLRGFQFERHPKINLPEERLAALEQVINRQIALILE